MHLGKVKEWGAAESILGDRVKEGKKGLTRTGNSELGELVLDLLRADLEERGPRGGKENESMGQGKTYESLDGKGGYGLEKRID
jgi:CCR4-NOT complex subunit CAF16